MPFFTTRYATRLQNEKKKLLPQRFDPRTRSWLDKHAMSLRIYLSGDWGLGIESQENHFFRRFCVGTSRII